MHRKYQRRAQLIHAGEIKYGINTGLRRTNTPPAAQALRLLDMCVDREHKRREMHKAERWPPRYERPKGVPSAVGAWNQSSFARFNVSAKYCASNPSSRRLGSTMGSTTPLPAGARALPPLQRAIPRPLMSQTQPLPQPEEAIAPGLTTAVLKKTMNNVSTLTREVHTMHMRTFVPGEEGVLDAQFLEIDRISRQTGLSTGKVPLHHLPHCVASLPSLCVGAAAVSNLSSCHWQHRRPIAVCFCRGNGKVRYV